MSRREWSTLRDDSSFLRCPEPVVCVQDLHRDDDSRAIKFLKTGIRPDSENAWDESQFWRRWDGI